MTHVLELSNEEIALLRAALESDPSFRAYDAAQEAVLAAHGVTGARNIGVGWYPPEMTYQT